VSTDVSSPSVVSFVTDPARLHHWGLSVDGAVATLTMQVSPTDGLRDDYELKLNSYDLSVDIELSDIVTRLRFEHPEVKAVVVVGGVDKVFCAGANIQMLAGSTHGHKVNFCKMTNETRNTIEESGTYAGQGWIAAVNGTAAGGGYELALACDEIVMIDDRSSAVSLPEVPLLAVLPVRVASLGWSTSVSFVVTSPMCSPRARRAARHRRRWSGVLWITSRRVASSMLRSHVVPPTGSRGRIDRLLGEALFCRCSVRQRC
jgi:hypothetical protein